MIKALKNKLSNKIDASGLAIFRMAYTIILLMELLQLYLHRSIIYDKVPFKEIGEFNPDLLFKFWFVIVIFLLVGLFTRFSTIVNYLFSVIIFSSAANYEYHVFYAYVGLNFLLIFMPVSRVLSLDSLIQKIKYSDIGGFYKPDNKVLAANYFVPVFAAIGLVYFDSILFKFTSPMWLKGLGMWLPANLPMATWSDTSFLMNKEYIVKFLGYLVIVFETIFIFLFWFKPFRVPFMIIGTTFHLGILLEFPIPWFALTVVAVYILMVPVKWWLRAKELLMAKEPIYTFYYDAECPLCIKTVVIIRHFDIFNLIACKSVQGNYTAETAFAGKTEEELLINIHGVDRRKRLSVGYDTYKGVLKAMRYTYPIGFLMGIPGISTIGKKVYSYIAGNRLTVRCTSETCPMPVLQKPQSEKTDYLVFGWNKLNLSKNLWVFILLFLTVSQFLISWFSPLTQIGLDKVSLKESVLNNTVRKPYTFFKSPLVKYFGITHHPVFMDGHFDNYNHIILTVYEGDNGYREVVPLLMDNGMAGELVNGAFWVNYTFRVSSPFFRKELFEPGVVPYLEYFKVKNKKALPEGRFVFYVKEIEIPKDWKYDFLKEQMAKPWVKAGEYMHKGESKGFVWLPNMEEIFENERK